MVYRSVSRVNLGLITIWLSQPGALLLLASGPPSGNIGARPLQLPVRQESELLSAKPKNGIQEHANTYGSKPMGLIKEKLSAQTLRGGKESPPHPTGGFYSSFYILP